MNSKNLFYSLSAILALVAIGLILSVHGANILLKNRSSALVVLKTSDQAVNGQKAQLAAYKKEIAKYASLNNIAKSVVPQDKDQAEAVREIVALANQSGISQLSSISFPPSTLGGIGTTVKSSNNLTQVTPVKGIAGVYNLQITIMQSNSAPVTYGNFIAFLTRLEQNRRTAQVTDISIQPDQSNPNLIAFTLVINEFIKP